MAKGPSLLLGRPCLRSRSEPSPLGVHAIGHEAAEIVKRLFPMSLGMMVSWASASAWITSGCEQSL